MVNIAEVVVDCPLKDIDKTFYYAIPNHLVNYIEIGSRVIVPFGNRTLQGFVVNFLDKIEESQYKLKEIENVFEYPSILDRKLIDLAKWMSYNYNSSLFSCIQSMLPRGVKLQFTEKYYLVKKTSDEDFNLFFKKPRTLGEIINNLKVTKEEILRCLSEGILEKKIDIKTNIQEKIDQEISLDVEQEEITLPVTALRQHELLELLTNQEWLSLSDLPTPLRNAAKTFIDKGYVKVREKRVFREPEFINLSEENGVKILNEEQKKAFDQLVKAFDSGNKEIFLLKGITGSGKTEIYLQFTQHVVNSGKDVIILVPEIALTPLMVSRFKSRFGDKVAVLHSGLSEAQKFDEWLKIKDGKVKIVVGARSAVFAPFKNLGVIIIDEEHESTYKQEVQPRYVTKDVAEYRISQEKGVLLLGSATPSVESYYYAQNGYYKLLELTNRANNRALPNINIVDMKEELIQGNKSIFSRLLYNSINETLQRGEQVILFLNKRGFSATTLCRNCGFTFKCPHCDVNLTSHHKGNFLICHYCNYSLTSPKFCPKCKGKHLRFNGLGTEKLKEEIEKHFPNGRVIRMDNDTMTTASSYNEVYQMFNEGKANVLVGTQMIAKGFDFPKVTLVGIILADLSLNFPDFRSSEKTFQLITQVAGRAGRAELNGKVILQTYTPEHYSIKNSATYNYLEFYHQELKIRESLKYPPFTRLAKIEVMAKVEGDGKKAIDQIYNSLKPKINNLSEDIQILGPVVPAITKIRGLYRYILIIKFPKGSALLDVINSYNFKKYIKNNVTSIKVDIDPGTLI
ncbi:primosomal protein N' [Anaerobranca gottschalkii]|uniref:Replication restart protein PriA n=1 Tax=Anaerobranca gottschalkii DSM 13577 TaxID=1120990 RepID=A0A1H9YX06_9FIRM|nr:primosomal protein N' [Anaerobranca gottschalkii]SES73783.1 replication restart DNA helicase PriA [Anaerobranca gottschalkii DSM 13577]